MTALEQVLTAIGNILKRKRAERLEIETKLAQYRKNREAPPKGLGSDYATISQEIRALEAGLDLGNKSISQ